MVELSRYVFISFWFLVYLATLVFLFVPVGMHYEEISKLFPFPKTILFISIIQIYLPLTFIYCLYALEVLGIFVI